MKSVVSNFYDCEKSSWKICVVLLVCIVLQYKKLLERVNKYFKEKFLGINNHSSEINAHIKYNAFLGKTKRLIICNINSRDCFSCWRRYFESQKGLTSRGDKWRILTTNVSKFFHATWKHLFIIFKTIFYLCHENTAISMFQKFLIRN